MREILFTGKSKDDGEWVVGSYIAHERSIEWPTEVSEDGETLFSEGAEIIPETLGEYTGLVDKNKKKIFEGHILKAKFGSPDYLMPYLVSFVGGSFQIKNKYGNIITPVQEYIDWFDAEIIGNIYDNPELYK